jgi:hypothetical protein
MAVAEIELSKVAVEVLLAAVLIDADHALFEDAEVTFNGVGMDRRVAGADLLPAKVIDRLVRFELGAEVVIMVGFVRNGPESGPQAPGVRPAPISHSLAARTSPSR